jgi:hypothetical protein
MLILAGCGRTGLHGGEPVEALLSCESELDCATADLCRTFSCVGGYCELVDTTDCDDGDVCTEERCVPETGLCEYRSVVRDEDGDGFPGPRPGYAPGAPGSCGDDCDDTNPNAYPGGVELCDGADNDCNGIVDDDAFYFPTAAAAHRVTPERYSRASAGGIASDGMRYGVTYHGTNRENGIQQNRFVPLGPDGVPVSDELSIASTNAASFTGPLVWTGSMYGTAWSDARVDANYEIYFNRLDRDGRKAALDLRVTDAPGFSIYPSLLWDGVWFVLVWEDRRHANDSQSAAVYAQRVSPLSELIGGNVELVPTRVGTSSPEIARGATRLGLVYTVLDGAVSRIEFRWLSPDLTEIGPAVDLGAVDGMGPSVRWMNDRFYVLWTVGHAASVGDAVYGAAVTEDGAIVMPSTRLTFGAQHTRGHSVLALGNRMLVFWADDAPGNYEIATATIDGDLRQVGPRQALTDDGAHSLGPMAAFGPSGDIGLIFRDDRTSTFQVYFRRLSCFAGR